jgi:hypothetical protein
MWRELIAFLEQARQKKRQPVLPAALFLNAFSYSVLPA